MHQWQEYVKHWGESLRVQNFYRTAQNSPKRYTHLQMLRQTTATGMRSPETETCQWVKSRVERPLLPYTLANGICLS
jgi:aspartate aminotransferase-like enzyme